MDGDTHRLETAEDELIKSISKTRHPATGGYSSSLDLSFPSPDQFHLHLSDSDGVSGKENQPSRTNDYRTTVLIESSDDDFEIEKESSMDGDTHRLETAEDELIKNISKTRHPATGGNSSSLDLSFPSPDQFHLHLSDSDGVSGKENQPSRTNDYRTTVLIESSDDDFEIEKESSMDGDTHRLETAEDELIKSISKTRHPATGGYSSSLALSFPSPDHLHLSDSDGGSGKENQPSRTNDYRTTVLIESSDDDSDQFLLEKATPKASAWKPHNAAKQVSEPVLVVSSDSDDSDYEKFIIRNKTPKPKLKTAAGSGSEDSLKKFIVDTDNLSSDDDFAFEKKTPPTSKEKESSMDGDTHRLETAEDELIRSISKTRHPATGGNSSSLDLSFPSPDQFHLSDSDGGSGKENQPSRTNDYRTTVLIESSDDDSDQFLLEKATPKASARKPHNAAKQVSEPVLVVSSDSDDSDYEKFIIRNKTPKPKLKTAAGSGSEDSLKKFIVDTDSLSSDDDFAFEKKTPPTSKVSIQKPPLSVPRPGAPKQAGPLSVGRTPLDMKTPAKTPVTRPKIFQTEPRPRQRWPKPIPISSLKMLSVDTDSLSSDDVFAFGKKTPPTSKVSPLDMKTPAKTPVTRPKTSQTEPRPIPISRVVVCKTPGCFLQSLSSYSHNFKKTKEDLTSKLYQLYNTSIFDSKLPTNMSLTWNKKLRTTAGFCEMGQERGGGNRYAQIELSVKVCDSADRLRDTLVHEMCHAASWLINGVDDNHGPFWKIYASKAKLAHPELPMVTRCHHYKINHKFKYQCNGCELSIGRHSKSLDTERFVCSLCHGRLVLLTPSKPRAPAPFATFVKENFGAVRQELVGQSHGDVMRKLSADFATKTRVSQRCESNFPTVP